MMRYRKITMLLWLSIIFDRCFHERETRNESILEELMADVLTKEQRRKNMQHIRSKDTQSEILLRKRLWEKGYRYRKNYKKLPGKPDIVLTKYRIVIFCDSDFFHGKDWDIQKKRIAQGEHGAYWIDKITRNMQRDHENEVELRALGWRVLRFWSCEIKKDVESCVKAIEEAVFEEKMMVCDDEV